ncbi:MAG: poly(R)-hydroxyalkanoic acid synthase subunit PhaE [Dehalococcoidales bacterium]|nr:poly(R)-hydroxyalkanoic acid synthase subunit PhaE [Dehalococcoidales bacterium]
MDDKRTERSAFESTQEVFGSWLKTYEETFGKLLKAPTVGPTREKLEKTMQGVPYFANYYASWMDTNINFQSVAVEAMRKTQEKVAAESPANYRDYYDIWLETYSDTFKEFLKSGHFAADIGKFVSNLMDVEQFNKEMLESNFLKPMNLPTKSEIDEIYKEIYLLKKKVRELTKQVKDLTAAK